MKKIDAHQHFWKYHPVKDAWITDEMKIIQKDFMPEDIHPLLQSNGINGCVTVQADQSEEETMLLLDLANKNSFIKGVVGWIDLCADNVEEHLDYFLQFEKLKGFRHIVQSEPEDDFILREDFCRGIGLLKKNYYTYDILIKPRHLKFARHFAELFPEQMFIIDHLAKPDIKNRAFSDWEKDIKAIAVFENVFCKISGMVTEADWKNWKLIDFKPYIDTVIENFGTKRVLFGSDWPVCLVAANYDKVCEIVAYNTKHLSAGESEALWGLNAIKFYRL